MRKRGDPVYSEDKKVFSPCKLTVKRFYTRLSAGCTMIKKQPVPFTFHYILYHYHRLHFADTVSLERRLYNCKVVTNFGDIGSLVKKELGSDLQ